jgi:C-terminal processing protease CtpA/Prc
LDGSNKTALLNAAQRKNFICSPYEFFQNRDLLGLSYTGKNVAILTIKTFSRQVLMEAKKDFALFLDSSFREIKQKGINRLIIDLRGNGGGADVYGAHLYSYLTNKPFKYYKEVATKERKLTSADHPNLSIQKPADDHYDGKVFFVINGLTFSAAAEFCAIAKSNNRGKFIGEETGGGYYGNTSGDFIDTLLPNTGISVSIPTAKYVVAVRETKEKDRGIIPDYAVAPKIEDILQNRDVQMEEAIKLTAANTSLLK